MRSLSSYKKIKNYNINILSRMFKGWDINCLTNKTKYVCVDRY